MTTSPRPSMEKCPAVWEEGKTSLPDNDNDNDNGDVNYDDNDNDNDDDNDDVNDNDNDDGMIEEENTSLPGRERRGAE